MELKRMLSLAIALSFIIFNLSAVKVSADTDETITEHITEEVIKETDPVVTEEVEVQTDDEAIIDDNSFGVGEVQAENDDNSTDTSETISEENGDANLEPSSETDQSISVKTETEDSMFQTITGDGKVEDIVNTKVFQITFPVEEHIIDYLADPQKLIYLTKEQAHPDEDYDDNSNVFFNNGSVIDESGISVIKYSNTSKPLTIVNKSSCAVNVVARVRAYYKQQGENKVLLSPDRNWENSETPSIYLGVLDNEMNETAISQGEKVITSSIAGCPEAYNFSYDQDSYVYRLMTDEELIAAGVSPVFQEYSLRLFGECNVNGDWKHNVEYTFPSVMIVWNVGFAASTRPYINDTEYSVAFDRDFEIPISMGTFDLAATAVASVEFIDENGSSVSIGENVDQCITDEDSITLTSGFISFAREAGGGKLKVRFNDVNNTEFLINLDSNSAPFITSDDIELTADSQNLSISYNLGVGSKAANKVSTVKFGMNDFSSSVYCNTDNGSVVFTRSALREIITKGGGTISIVFDDEAHTRCSLNVKVKKDK